MLPNKEFASPISKSRQKADLINIANGWELQIWGPFQSLSLASRSTSKLIKNFQLIQSFRSCSCIDQESQKAGDLRVKERIVLTKLQKMLLRNRLFPQL